MNNVIHFSIVKKNKEEQHLLPEAAQATSPKPKGYKSALQTRQECYQIIDKMIELQTLIDQEEQKLAWHTSIDK